MDARKYERQKKDIDEGIDFSEEGFNRRLKRISRSKFLDEIPKNVSSRNSKSRITIYLDADIIEHFKQEVARNGIGYQTSINYALRSLMKTGNVLPEQIKENLSKDKSFLKSLKKALAS